VGRYARRRVRLAPSRPLRCCTCCQPIILTGAGAGRTNLGRPSLRVLDGPCMLGATWLAVHYKPPRHPHCAALLPGCSVCHLPTPRSPTPLSPASTCCSPHGLAAAGLCEACWRTMATSALLRLFKCTLRG